MAETKDFMRITTAFNSSICTLRAFNEEIGRAADQQDQAIQAQFLQNMAAFAGITVEELKSEVAQFEASKSGDLSRQLSESQRQMADALKGEPEKAYQFFRLLMNSFKVLPLQGALLRRGVLNTLISHFEMLISDLIQVFYQKYPEALPAENRVLSLADLRMLGSVEEAEKYLVTKEVDSVLWGNVEDQLDYFAKKLKVYLGPIDSYRNELIEISQRRNLFVHNDGIINRTYLNKVPRDYIESCDIQEGQPLPLKHEYLVEAIDTIFVCGIIIIQQCWRKWELENLHEADAVLATVHIYDALLEGRYELVKRLAKLADTVEFSSEKVARVATINHAIALKEVGEHDEMEAVLEKKDWSACALKFQVALHVLRDEEDAVFEVLPKAVAAGDINLSALKEWPLFRHLRNDSRFIDFVEQHFPNGEIATPLQIEAG